MNSLYETPAKALLRFVLHKALSKFLVQPVELSEEDLSLSDIVLNKLEFNCHTLNQMLASQLRSLKLIECTVDKLTIHNWRNSSTATSVKVSVEKIDVLIMPVEKAPTVDEAGEESKTNEKDCNNNDVDQQALNRLKPRDLQEIDSELGKMQGETSFLAGLWSDIKSGIGKVSGDVLNGFLANLELDLSKISVRCMMRELTDVIDSDTGTLFCLIDKVSLTKRNQGGEQEIRDDFTESAHFLLHNKQLQLNSMRLFKADSPSMDLLGQNWTLPHANLAENLLIWQTKNNTAAMHVNFNYRLEKGLAPELCLEGGLLGAQLILTSKQVRELTDFSDYLSKLNKLYPIAQVNEAQNDPQEQLSQQLNYRFIIENVSIVLIHAWTDEAIQKPFEIVEREVDRTAQWHLEIDLCRHAELAGYVKQVQHIPSQRPSSDDLHISELMQSGRRSFSAASNPFAEDLRSSRFSTVSAAAYEQYQSPQLNVEKAYTFKMTEPFDIRLALFDQPAQTEAEVSEEDQSDQFHSAIMMQSNASSQKSSLFKFGGKLNEDTMFQSFQDTGGDTQQFDDFGCDEIVKSEEGSVDEPAELGQNAEALEEIKEEKNEEQIPDDKQHRFSVFTINKFKYMCKETASSIKTQISCSSDQGMTINLSVPALAIMQLYLPKLFDGEPGETHDAEENIEQAQQPLKKSKQLTIVPTLTLAFHLPSNADLLSDELIELGQITRQMLDGADVRQLCLNHFNCRHLLKYDCSFELSIDDLRFGEDLIKAGKASLLLKCKGSDDVVLADVDGVCCVTRREHNLEPLEDIDAVSERMPAEMAAGDSSDENYHVVVEHDEADDHVPELFRGNSNAEALDARQAHQVMSIEIKSIVVSAPITPDNLLPTIQCVQNAQSLLMGYLALKQLHDKIVEEQTQHEPKEELGPNTAFDIQIASFNFMLTEKEDLAVCAFKIDDTSVSFSQASEPCVSKRMNVQMSSKTMIVADLRQRKYGLLPKHSFKSSLFKQQDDEDMTGVPVSKLASLSCNALHRKYEEGVLLFKHSSFLDNFEHNATSRRPVIKVDVSVTFDMRQEYRFRFESFRQVLESWLDKAPLTTPAALPLLLSDLWADLDVNPMRPLKCSIQLRDLQLRVQPAITQIGQHSLLAQINKIGETLKKLKTSPKYAIKVPTMPELRGDIDMSDQILLQLRLHGFAVDVHPLKVYEAHEQKGPKRIPERLLLSLQYASCTLSIFPQAREIHLSAKQFSLRCFVEDIEKLNPLTLAPGMQVEKGTVRYPLNLLESTPAFGASSYVDAIGFRSFVYLTELTLKCSHYEQEVIQPVARTLVDLDVLEWPRHKFASFVVKVDSKAIMLYFSKDVVTSLRNLAKGLQSNMVYLQQMKSESDKKNENGAASQSSEQLNFEHSKLSGEWLPEPEEAKSALLEQERVNIDDMEFEEKKQKEKENENFQVYDEPSIAQSQVLPQIDDGVQIGAGHSQAKYLRNLFKIQQFNKFEHKGAKSVRLAELIRENHIPRVDNSTSLKIKKHLEEHRYDDESGGQSIDGIIKRQRRHHRQPLIELAKCIDEDDLAKFLWPAHDAYQGKEPRANPYKFMQPKLSLIVHIHQVDMKLFDRSDFNFSRPQGAWEFGEVTTAELRQLLRKPAEQLIDQSQISASIATERRRTAVIDENYTSSSSRSIRFQRKRASQAPTLHYQVLVLDASFSQHKLKNVMFRKRAELKQSSGRMLYKLEKSMITVRSVSLKEDLSTGKPGQCRMDTFQLPYAYKYDNFLEASITIEHMVKEKLLSVNLSLQPFRFKMQQDVVNFLLRFTDMPPSAEQESFEHIERIRSRTIAEDKESLDAEVMKTKVVLNQLIEDSQKRPSFKSHSDQLLGNLQGNNVIDEDYIKINHSTAVTVASKKQVPTFLKMMRIKQTQIVVSYSSRTFTLSELLHSNSLQSRLEYLNLCNIKDLTLCIKEFNLQQKLETQKAIQHCIQFYCDDIIANQKLSILGALGPISRLSRLGSSLFFEQQE